MKTDFSFTRIINENGVCTCAVDDADIMNHRSHLSQYNYLCVQLMAKTSSEYNMPGIQLCFAQGEATQQFAFKLLSGYQLTLVFPLKWLHLHIHFLPPAPGVLKGHKLNASDQRLWLPEQTEHILLSYDLKDEIDVFHVFVSDYVPDTGIRSADTLIDASGQYSKKEWYGKTGSEYELIATLHDAYVQAVDSPGRSHNTSLWGGWKNKKFTGTGYFRAQAYDDGWILVDPEGYPFFSHGVCYAWRTGEFTFVDGYEPLYEWLPDRKDALFTNAWTTSNQIDEYFKRYNELDQQDKWMVSFSRANLIRAFGAKWRERYYELTSLRLRRWGINTVGVGVNQYRDERVSDIPSQFKLPYVLTLKNYPRTQNMITNEFPDVFSAEYSVAAEEYADQIRPYLEDQYLVGYFITNEPTWAMRHASPTKNMLISDQSFASKTAYVRYLRNKYGEISNLNEVWDANFSDYSMIEHQSTDIADYNQQAAQDATDFDRILIREYIRIPCEALRQIDAHHMNLGMRYAGSSWLKQNISDGAEYFDVISFNLYREDPFEDIEAIGKAAAKPVMIGEYHFSALDAGLPPTPLSRPSGKQSERGAAYKNYVTRAAQSKYCVGAHYFEYHDQPWLGRFDGENYGIGFVDVCNKPYDKFIEAVSSCEPDLEEIVMRRL